MVNINDAPGFDGAEVYHPRWTNHPRFFVIATSASFDACIAGSSR